jgi:hypothetical protein
LILTLFKRSTALPSHFILYHITLTAEAIALCAVTLILTLLFHFEDYYPESTMWRA